MWPFLLNTDARSHCWRLIKARNYSNHLYQNRNAQQWVYKDWLNIFALWFWNIYDIYRLEPLPFPIVLDPHLLILCTTIPSYFSGIKLIKWPSTMRGSLFLQIWFFFNLSYCTNQYANNNNIYWHNTPCDWTFPFFLIQLPQDQE